MKILDSIQPSVDSYHHSTSGFSFLTGFSHFIFSYFWLNSSEWSWADVVGIVQGFFYKFSLLTLCRLHIYKHQWLFFSLLFEVIVFIHRILLLRLQGKHIEMSAVHWICRCLQFKLGEKCPSERWQFYIVVQIPTVPLQ